MAKTKQNLFKLCVLALCICLVPILAGCELVTTNVNKQLGEVVASFDNGRVEVTREQLIMTYNSIGNSRYDNSGAPTEEGVEKTVELAINRAILVDFLTADDMEEKRSTYGISKVALTTYQANEVWRSVYEYINDSVKSYENELRKEDGLSALAGEEEAGDESSTDYVEYEHTYEYYYDSATQTYVLSKIEKDVIVENLSIALFDTSADLTFDEKAETAYNTFRSKYWEYSDSIVLNPTNTNDVSYSDKAWTKFMNALIRSEAERNLSKDFDEVFLREVQRIYDVYYENQVLTVFQENYNKNLMVTKEDVATKFKSLYDAQVEYFGSNASAFDNLIPTSGEKVYYMQKPSEYFKVNHILVKFSDEQNARIEAEKTKFDNEMITYAQYLQNIAAIKSETKAYNRDTDEYESMSTVYSSLTNALNAVSGDSAKMAVFRDFMHRYSNDDATLNADSCYYIPTTKKVIDPATGKTNDVMQEAFADGSRELYDDGVIGGYSTWIETSYGYHIIMYTGDAKSINGTLATDSLLSQLNGYFLNPLYSKTMLDSVIELVTLSSYSTYETNLLNAIKADKTVTINKSSFSDLY